MPLRNDPLEKTSRNSSRPVQIWKARCLTGNAVFLPSTRWQPPHTFLLTLRHTQVLSLSRCLKNQCLDDWPHAQLTTEGLHEDCTFSFILHKACLPFTFDKHSGTDIFIRLWFWSQWHGYRLTSKPAKSPQGSEPQGFSPQMLRWTSQKSPRIEMTWLSILLP